MKKKTLKTTKLKKPKRDAELPVTKRLLDLTKQELKGDISTLRLEMKAEFAKLDARFSSIDARFDSQDARFSSIDARFDSQDARFASIDHRFEEISTQLKKMTVILEEQNDRNRAALDGYAAVYGKHFLLEDRIIKLEQRTFGSEQG